MSDRILPWLLVLTVVLTVLGGVYLQLTGPEVPFETGRERAMEHFSQHGVF